MEMKMRARESDGASDVFDLRKVSHQFDLNPSAHTPEGQASRPTASSHVPPLLRLCFDLVVRHVNLCESLAGLPPPALRSLFALALRRHVIDRRLLRLAAASGLQQLDPVDIALALGFTRDGLKTMKQLQSATSLDLSGPGKAGDCRNLATLLPGMGACLRSLNLAHYPHSLALADVRAIAGLTGLESLDMSHTPLTDAWLKEIAGMTHLTSLRLHYCRELQGDVPELAGMQLTHLDMSGNVIGPALSHIGKITTLKALNLSLSTITNTSCLAELKQLEVLNLSNTSLEEIEHLCGLTGLRQLDLARAGPLMKRQAHHLTRLTNLTHLNVAQLRLSAGLIKAIAEKNPKLTNLCIEGSAVKRKHLDHLLDVRPNAFVESHLVPVAGLIDALRRHKHNQGIVTQTLRLLQAKASREEEPQVWRHTPGAPTPPVEERLATRKTAKQHRQAQQKRAVPYNVNESGLPFKNLTSAFDDDAVAAEVVDALYGLLGPHHLHLAVLNKVLELLRHLARNDRYVTLLADARWLAAFYHLLWTLPQHTQTVLQTLRLMLDHIPKGRGNVQLANTGLQPLLAEIISLHPGDVGIVGHALEIASRFGSGVGLEKWLAPERMAALLRAMRDHPRQITVVEPALLVLTLLENRGHGPALVAAGAFRALAQAGANYPAAFDVAQWTPESCVVVNTATLIDLLRTHAGVEVPEERDTMKRLRGLWATLQARDTATPTTTTAAVADIDRQRHGEANRNRRQKRKARKFAQQQRTH
ncbi:leucine rich repeat domain containing protein [Acanthamoeba castellanii str. Neff]|uniref:Leucine rich repeat domain containing protein n=1 Tax=Acanthamoeba castellanii (strain ATCC 30010 / Neff) TaxID=1257118 RepID=L8H5N7_ACACF|nr:leucine rich repeat domain containing protein [Acanthamoeba castellanii str. Neff]ELR20537.1 leucine rich repeat domain containing protein [Acanthamoeba castellanii str. Neff]